MNRVPLILFVAGFLYAALFAQGIPLWDDDFTSWFWKIKDKSIFRYVWEWLWPVSTQPQYWGFNERPAQAFIYKFFHAISGYESWSYFLFKDLVYGGLGVLVYAWIRALGGSLWPAVAAAALFLTAPNPMAAHFLHSDLAPLAELLFGGLLLWIFVELERTPASWKGFPDPRVPERREWLTRWMGISFCVYLSYKTKGDTRAIPMILALFVLLTRPRQWALFAVPVAAMVLLAIPWGPGLFSKLPPWMPGSKGSEIGWMYQPASAGRVLDFLWPDDGLGAFKPLSKTPLSYFGILGPFLLLPLVAYLVRREAAGREGIVLYPPADRRGRGVLFVWIWLAATLAVVSALPELNWVFRVRYGIITFLPLAVLIGLLFDRFAQEYAGRAGRWVLGGAVAVLVLQLGVNVARSAKQRRDLGSVMVAVDKVYGEVAARFSDWTLTMLPDFRPYDYRPEVSKAIDNRKWLGSAAELAQYPVGRTLVISWSPQLGDEFEWLGRFEGCRKWVLFDLLYPCVTGTGTNLMRYVGVPPELARARALRTEGKSREAREQVGQVLEAYPGHLGGWFLLGLLAQDMGDFRAMEQAFERVSVAAPTDPRVQGYLETARRALAEKR